jgi:2-phosphosulfolactate phosphatase
VIRLAKYRIAAGPGPFPELQGDEVIVLIDTLRASSTIATALSLGIETVIPVLDDEQAFSLKDDGTLLSGEAGGVKIPGYDIGNSPVELIKTYRQSPFLKLVLKTSNFIPILVSLHRAVVCSTLNLAAVARFLDGKDALILAAGGRRGSAEDVGTALALAGILSGVQLDAGCIQAIIRESHAAQHLCGIGYAQDVDFIARVNVFDIVPLYDGSVIRKAGSLHASHCHRAGTGAFL